ncbi:assimilatory nitrate reductase (NADH) alpha subunit apoprotein [Paraperlucidibaca baekdonensis]|uniref:Assimilatory nitrate reductase (NADH) alpha subunit apoprotein n=1 Tax=Paraperlucidibaca baekdonensis TaxID=748120 RepID=A0A3E0H6W9_9GAMM|nr:nitrate reductase [Paraperlucidibaca baekdonensis]REH38988.1 assimilatory nitrate reductase (NADH) alpha subunit apoprotein [Paraperlucidibaca baekdonensis]
MADMLTTCPYCGVGCGVAVSLGEPAAVSELLAVLPPLESDSISQHAAVTVHGDDKHPANYGRLCVKGSALADTTGLERRLLYPQVDGLRASWAHALSQVAQRLQDTIDNYGPDSVAFYVSGQLLTEDYYVANKLMKGFIGSANIDTNSRLCMSTAVAAHKQIFGSDSVPGCYEDLELADLIILVGSNMAWTHPVIYQRIIAAKKARPHLHIVVIDPRRTATAESADSHLAITPGSDGFLFDGLLAYAIKHDHLAHDFIAAHTEGFAALASACTARNASLAVAAAATGMDESVLSDFYAMVCAAPKTVTVFSQGINQSAAGVDNASAILQCHLALGHIGQVGAGAFSMTGQPNAMGGREVGGLANQLAAHMDIGNAEHRDLVSRFWQTDTLAPRAGLKAVDMFEAMASGKIRFVWIMATNPLVSLPDANRVHEALAACDCVVVSDCVDDTDTLRLADIRLPASGWGEKDGTVTNSERRISRQRAFLTMPSEAKPDWWALCEVAKRLGYSKAFDYSGAAAIFREHAALSAFENQGRRDFDLGALAALTDADYDALEPVQWPVPIERPEGSKRLFSDGHFFTPTGRARFIDAHPSAAKAGSATYPFLLNSGRIRDQWHTMTRTGRSPRLLNHIAEPFVAIHPDDLAELGAQDAQLMRIHNRFGRCQVRALSDAGMTRGQVFMPIHWSASNASQALVSSLVAPQCDPISGQPAFKQTPVAISPLKSQWQGLLVSRVPLSVPEHQYWCRREQADWQLTTLMGASLPSIEELMQLWQSPGRSWASLDEPLVQRHHVIAYDHGRPVLWFLAQSERPQIDEPWLLDALTQNSVTARVLATGRPPGGSDTSALVCSCHQVREQRLLMAIADGSRSVEALGACTRAGTNCGSCIPELKGLLAKAASG